MAWIDSKELKKLVASAHIDNDQVLEIFELIDSLAQTLPETSAIEEVIRRYEVYKGSREDRIQKARSEFAKLKGE
jgi:hypothetical protein